MGAELLSGFDLAASLRRQLEDIEETIAKTKRQIQDNEDMYTEMTRTRQELQEIMSIREQRISDLAQELPNTRFVGGLQQFMSESSRSSNSALLDSFEADIAGLKRCVMDDDSKLTELLSQKAAVADQLAAIGQGAISLFDQMGGE